MPETSSYIQIITPTQIIDFNNLDISLGPLMEIGFRDEALKVEGKVNLNNHVPGIYSFGRDIDAPGRLLLKMDNFYYQSIEGNLKVTQFNAVEKEQVINKLKGNGELSIGNDDGTYDIKINFIIPCP